MSIENIDGEVPAVEQPVLEVKPVEVTPEVPTDDIHPEDEQAEKELAEEAEKPKKLSGVQRLKNKVERLQADLQRALEARPDPVKPIAASSDKPDPNQFDDHDDYLAALAKHAGEEAIRKYREEQKAEEERSKQKQNQETWASKIGKAHASHPDLEDLIEDARSQGINPPAELQAFVLDSDLGPDVIHEVFKSPEECRRLAGLSRTRQIAELGRIEDKLAAKGKSKNPEPKTISKAPAPMIPTTPSGVVIKDRDTRIEVF